MIGKDRPMNQPLNMLSRRQLLKSASAGFGYLALAGLLGENSGRAAMARPEALASLVRPSMGAWMLYGLGTENQDLPGYITINPPPDVGGATNYGSAFLPPHFQGTRINDAGYLPNLKAPTSLGLQRKQLDLLQ